MVSKRTLMFTGLLGWLGGLATTVVSGSCDVQECAEEPRPSVVLTLSPAQNSHWDPVENPAKAWFEVGSDFDNDFAGVPLMRRGHCLDEDCTMWQLGSDEAGHYQIEVDVCGKKYTTEVQVGDLGDECGVATERIELEIDGAACTQSAPREPMRPGPPGVCDIGHQPSVHAMIAQDMGDYLAPVPVDAVWYEYQGEVFEAYCVRDGEGACVAWIAGYGLVGEIKVHTEYCDEVVTSTVDVGVDHCRVETEFMILPVSTRKCLVDDPPGKVPPPPPHAGRERGYG